MKINFKRFLRFIYLLMLFILLFASLLDFANYPEKYITTWKYQLKNDISAGDTEAIEYYQSKYINKDIELFEL